MPDFSRLGDALTLLRRRAGLSQAEVAERSAATQSNVSRYERGESQPNLETLGRLLDCFGSSLSDLELALRDVQQPGGVDRAVEIDRAIELHLDDLDEWMHSWMGRNAKRYGLRLEEPQASADEEASGGDSLEPDSRGGK